MRVLLAILLTSAVLISAVQVTLAQHEARRTFAEIRELEETRDRLNEEWGRLQLEQSTWATADRIETLATSELDMVSPQIDSTTVLITP